MPTSQHQGKFGEDYVRVLAFAAGLLVMKDDPDVEGIDLGFRATGQHGRVSSPAIEARIKTWSAPSVSSGYPVSRGLSERQFNTLCRGRTSPLRDGRSCVAVSALS
jgi:hypothetical protein